MTTRKQFLQRQFELSVQAGTSQRYHQTREHHWSGKDKNTRMAVGFAAVVAVCLTILCLPEGHDVRVDYCSISFAAVSAFLAVGLNIFPFGEYACRHAALFQRWTDVREDVDTLLFDLGDGEPDAYLVTRLKELAGKVHRICGTEPDADEKLIQQCYDAEMKSRKPDRSLCEAQVALEAATH